MLIGITGGRHHRRNGGRKEGGRVEGVEGGEEWEKGRSQSVQIFKY
jgi:hypothetical protein